MTFIQKYWDWITLTILITTFTVVLATLSLLRHNAFASGFDLGNMDQTIWNSLHGNIFNLTGEKGTVSRFSIHADIILIFLTPLYLLWNDVRMLMISDAFFLALAAIPIYLLSVKVLKNKIISFIVVISYLLNPSMQWTHMYDFHPVALSIPLLISAFYCAYTKKWQLYWVFVILALLIKEEISLQVATLGMYIFFLRKERLIGSLSMALGAGWFLLMVGVIIPSFNTADKHWALSWYSSPVLINHNYAKFAKDMFDYLVSHLFSKEAFIYYNSLFRPFAYIPILGVPFLFLSVPEFLINLLSNHDQMRSLILHYDSGITPSLVISTIFGIAWLTSFGTRTPILKDHKKLFLPIIGISLISCSLVANYLYSPMPYSKNCWCISYNVTQEDKEF